MDFVTPFIEWLLQSDYIKKNKLFFNAVKAQNGNIQIVLQPVSQNQTKTYIDGSKFYPLTFYISSFKAANYNPLIESKISSDENLGGMLDVSQIIEFVEKMNEEKNFPVFSKKITVEKVYCQYNTPPVPAFDGGLTPLLAKFSIPVVFEVLEDA